MNDDECQSNYYFRRYIRFNIVIIAIVWVGYFFIQKAISPMMVTNVALGQFDNTAASFSNMQLINFIQDKAILVPIILTAIITIKILKLIKQR